MNLASLFKNDVHVIVQPSAFVFSCRKNRSEISTYVLMSLEEEPMVLAVGEDYRGMTRFERIDFLSLDSESKELKLKCLQCYLRFGLLKVVTGFFAARPIVFFHNATLLKSSLGDNFEAILDSATRMAGAREVVFK